MSRENSLLVRSVVCINFRVRTFVLRCLSWSVGSVSLLEGGKCCPFFSLCVFDVWSGVLCRFFDSSSFLRVVV